jgi:hypothetical protein
MAELTAEQISKLVSENIDGELRELEQQVIKQYGGIEAEISVDEKIEEVKELEFEAGVLQPVQEPVAGVAEPELEITLPGVEEHKPEEPKTKAYYIDKILEIQAKSGGGEHTKGKLSRKKRDELEQMLAHMLGEEAQKLVGMKGQVIDQANSIAEFMFMMHLTIAQVGELASDQFKEYTGDVAILEGWSDNMTEEKEELIAILLLLYKENKVVVDKYLTTASRYGIWMLKSMGLTIFKNVAKKKKHSNSELKQT